MNDAPEPETALLEDLHAGRISRNRDFAYFQSPAALRARSGYRRLKSLVGELLRPDVEVRVHHSRQSGEPAVEILVKGLRYHRLVLLTPPEFEFLRTRMAEGFFPVSPS